MGKRRFRNYLIHPPLQWRITVKFVIPAIVFALLSGAILCVIAWPSLSECLPQVLYSGLKSAMLVGLLLSSGGMLCLMLVWGIVVTHHIAGPINRMQQQLEQVLAGQQVQPLQLRRSDEFHEFAEVLNRAIRKIQQDSVPTGD